MSTISSVQVGVSFSLGLCNSNTCEKGNSNDLHLDVSLTSDHLLRTGRGQLQPR